MDASDDVSISVDKTDVSHASSRQETVIVYASSESEGLCGMQKRTTYIVFASILAILAVIGAWFIIHAHAAEVDNKSCVLPPTPENEIDFNVPNSACAFP